MKKGSWLLELARILLSFSFILSGLLKAIDPIGTVIKVHEYQTSVFGIVSQDLLALSPIVAYSLIALEFSLGVFLFAGIYRRLSSRLTFVVMVVMMLLTAYLYATGRVVDCGCFGDAIKMTPLETFLKNLLLLPLSAWVMIRARQLRHFFTRRERWIPGLLAIFGVSYLIYQGANDLPAHDFLPYPIRTNIQQRIVAADSAFQADLARDTRYIYSKAGERRAFTIDQLPDTTWRYEEVSQPMELLMKRPSYDFVLLTSDGEDVTHEILANDRGVVLLLSPSWRDATQGQIHTINELYRYAETYGYTFYSVSPSPADEEAEWRYQTGGEYPNLFMDATTIRMITRANPGVLILKGGTIIDKIPSSRLPEVDEIPSFIASRLERGVYTEPRLSRWIAISLLALVMLYGIIRRILRRYRVIQYLATQ